MNKIMLKRVSSSLLVAWLVVFAASSDQHRYAIVFDAGSSGTRVNVYEWSQPDNIISSSSELSDRAWYVRKAIASLRQIGHKKIKPGVSDFKNAVPDGEPGLCNVATTTTTTTAFDASALPSDRVDATMNWSVNSTCLANAMEMYLRPLKDYALSALPDDLVTKLSSHAHGNPFPQQPLVMFYATAGMRLVSPQQESNILSAVRLSLSTGAFGAAFGRATTISAPAGVGNRDGNDGKSADSFRDHVRVLTGPEEATLDWLAVNAALGLNLLPSASLAQGPGGLSAVRGLADAGAFQEEAELNGHRDVELEPVGALDLGGWSTQIAFAQAPRSSRSITTNPQAAPLSAPAPRSAEFVAASHLGFGVLRAFDLALDACAAHALALKEAKRGRIGDEIDNLNDEADSNEWHACPCLSPGQEVVHMYRLPAYVPPRQRRPAAAVDPDADGVGGDVDDSQSSEASAMHRRWARHGAMAAGGDGSEVENGAATSAEGDTSATGSTDPTDTEVEVDVENDGEDEELTLAERAARVGELAVFSDWEWEDWVSASDLDGSGAIDASELVDVLQRRERTKPVSLQTPVTSSSRSAGQSKSSRSGNTPRSSRFDASLDGSPDGGLTLARDILEVADLDNSGDIDFAEFAAIQRGVLQSHPELMTTTPGSSSSTCSSKSAHVKAIDSQRQDSNPNEQGSNDSIDDGEDVVAVRLRGTGDVLACRAVARGIVAAGISGSPEANAWQKAKKEGGSSKHGKSSKPDDSNGSDRSNDDDDAPAGSGLGGGQHWSIRDRGVFFAIDVFGTVGNQMLEKLLIRASSNAFSQPSEKKTVMQDEQQDQTSSNLVLGVEVSSDGSTSSSPPASPVDSASDILPRALRELALTQPLVPYIDLGPELGHLRVVNLGCSAVHERWALSRDEGLQSGRRQHHPCGDPLDTSANDHDDDNSSSTSGSSATRYAAATAAQLAMGAVDLCAEPWPVLLARLGPEGKGENILKVERLCFGAAYVLELLSAYGLLRPEHDMNANANAPADDYNSTSSDHDNDHALNNETAHAVGRDGSGNGGARVVFVESFGELEASWALGALVHRLLSEPPLP